MSLGAILAGLATGIILGVFGSGGSIITIPALIYFLHVEPKSAIAMGMGIVAITATLTAIQHWLKGNVNLEVTAVFGLFGIFGTYAGARLGVVTPVVVQLTLFALVMYAAAWKMLRPGASGEIRETAEVDCHRSRRDILHIAMHGVVVGALTGLVGVGGGFLIVPALALFCNLTMRQAVGTSLAIVALKSYAGFAGYAGKVPMDHQLMGLFAAVAVVGSIVGTQVSQRLSGEGLRRGFAAFLLLVASYILASQAGVL